MDIWRWVEGTKRELRGSGHGRLVALMDELPSAVCNDEHGRVEAIVPEAVALARVARKPWVEVFVRHWALQSRVLHRYEAREHLGEAVALLELASREDTRECPQSVCVTQDLAACYACADGPGYVEERLAVAAETLARIDPSWPCFQCISDEYAAALRDDERHEDALAFLEAQIDRATQAGVGELPRFTTSRAESLLVLGRVDEAWALMEGYEAEPSGGASREVDVELMRARVLAGLGRYDEAERVLPGFELLAETPSHYEDYGYAVLALVEAGRRPNDVELGVQLRHMITRAERNGARFVAAQTAAMATRLAVQRGAWAVARTVLATAERLRGELRKPERVVLDGLREAIARGTAVGLVLPETPDEVRETLPEDPEAAVEVLIAACRRWPDHQALAVMHGRALSACALQAQAEAALREHVARHPEAEAVVVELGRTLLGHGRHEALVEWVAAAMQGESLRTQGLWLLASSFMKANDDLDGAAQALGELLELDPEAKVPRHRLANLELRRGRFVESLEHLDRLIAQTEPGEHDWDRMTVATIVGAWDRLRSSARRLGLEFPGLDEDGPVDTPMGLCQVRFVEDDGARHDYFAERRSPVCARVVQMAGPRRPEHFADLVVFDAGPLNPRGPAPAGEDGEDDEWVPLFPVVHVVSEGELRSWSLDGTHPGEAAWDALVEALQAQGGVVDVRSDESYQLEDPSGDGTMLTGVFAYACMPRGLEPAALHERLAQLTRGWPHPLVWPELVEALPAGEERERALARVAEITERYGL